MNLYVELVLVFFLIGAFCFGGGYGILPLFHSAPTDKSVNIVGKKYRKTGECRYVFGVADRSYCP